MRINKRLIYKSKQSIPTLSERLLEWYNTTFHKLAEWFNKIFEGITQLASQLTSILEIIVGEMSQNG